jgi:hypothetical protein
VISTACPHQGNTAIVDKLTLLARGDAETRWLLPRRRQVIKWPVERIQRVDASSIIQDHRPFRDAHDLMQPHWRDEGTQMAKQ